MSAKAVNFLKLDVYHINPLLNCIINFKGSGEGGESTPAAPPKLLFGLGNTSLPLPRCTIHP